jgi:hypothetical protein
MKKQIREFYIRSPLAVTFTEQFVRSVMDLGVVMNLVDIGRAIGILAGNRW